MKNKTTLNRVIRLDSMPLSETFFTPEGYLHDRPILTSTGIFEYGNPDGSVRRELRLPEDVFDPESLKSYKGKPIIVTHDAGLVDKYNVSEEQIGTILTEGMQDGSDVRAEIVIHDTDEMKSCGLKELSLGYNLELDETPGVWNGQPYDAIQRNIRINHLALVREARAGEQARLNIDGRDSKTILKGGKAMKKPAKKSRRADGILSPEELAIAIADYQAKRASQAVAADEEAPADTDKVVSTMPDTAPAVDENATIEEKVEMVKDRKDRRDAEGEPETVEEAEGIIAKQDEDMSILFDIIDTLLAEKAFDEAAPATAEGEEVATDEDDVPAEEGTAAATDEGEEEVAAEGETATDGDDENCDEDDVPTAEEGTATDEGEEGEAVAEDEDDVPADESKTAVNADSVDRLIRQRVKLGMIGRTLNLDGLEDMPIMKAKKAVIKAVRPGIRLDGKSKAYIEAAFDCACDEVKKTSKKSTEYQKKQMFNKDGRTTSKVSGSVAARQRMIDRQQKKEDK